MGLRTSVMVQCKSSFIIKFGNFRLFLRFFVADILMSEMDRMYNTGSSIVDIVRKYKTKY